jgi:hypothetical protein
LWKIDADDQVKMVADIYPGLGSSNPQSFASFNGSLYFGADGGPQGGGRELWRFVPERQSHQNPVLPVDVDGDGDANIGDLLELVAFLRTNGPTELTGGAIGPPYFDVTGDGRANINDVVQVIGALRAQLASVQGEAEREIAILLDDDGGQFQTDTISDFFALHFLPSLRQSERTALWLLLLEQIHSHSLAGGIRLVAGREVGQAVGVGQCAKVG